MKSKSTAILLAFFLGGFGIHQFYLKNTGKGIAYLIFFWTFIPAFIAIIDFIMLIVKSDDEFNKKYNAEKLEIERLQNEAKVTNERVMRTMETLVAQKGSVA